MRLWSLHWVRGRWPAAHAVSETIHLQLQDEVREVAVREVRRSCKARQRETYPSQPRQIRIILGLARKIYSLFCFHLWLLGLILTLLSCSDGKQAGRMWSMGSELANLIFLCTAGCRVTITSHQTIAATYTNAPTHVALQTVSFIFLFF